MKARTGFLLRGVLCFNWMILFVSAASAQHPTNVDPSDFTAKVVNLKHANAHQVAQAIEELELPIRVSAAGDRQLLLHGSAEGVKIITDTLVSVLDESAASQEAEAATEFIRLPQRYNSQELSRLLAVIVEGSPIHDANFAIDRTNQMLVARAAKPELAAIRTLLEELDRPSRSIEVKMFFLRATIGGDADASARLPSALQPIAKTLAENGFGSLSLMTPLVMVTEDGQRFQSNSTLRQTGEDGSSEDLLFDAEGTVQLPREGKEVQLTLRAKISGRYATNETADGITQLSIESMVTTSLEDFVILAASPGSTASGNAVAIVVQVTAD